MKRWFDMRQRHEARAWRSVSGFSLTELLIVILVVLAGIAVAQPSISGALKSYGADRAMQMVMGQMMRARQFALDNRRNYQVTLDSSAKSITITRMATASETATQQSVVYLPNNVSLSCYGSGAACSVEGFSTSNALTTATFRPDGSAVAVDGSGNVPNGVIFVTRTDPYAAKYNRAILFYGATSRIKGLRYTGVAWIQ